MEKPMPGVKPPRFEDRKTFLVAGLSERYYNRKFEGIPAQWQRFAPHIGKIPGQIGSTTYGVCFNMDGIGNMDYMCGVEVSDASDASQQPALPECLSRLRIAEQRYAVFLHSEHISTIAKTWDAILSNWAPASGCAIAKAPQFEVYGSGFDPRAGNGGLEIWIPVNC